MTHKESLIMNIFKKISDTPFVRESLAYQ